MWVQSSKGREVDNINSDQVKLIPTLISVVDITKWTRISDLFKIKLEDAQKCKKLSRKETIFYHTPWILSGSFILGRKFTVMEVQTEAVISIVAKATNRVN